MHAPFPLRSNQADLIESSIFDQVHIDSSGSVLASERVVHRSVISARREPLELTLLWNHVV